MHLDESSQVKSSQVKSSQWIERVESRVGYN